MARVAICVLLLLLLLPAFCAAQGLRVFTIDTVVGGAVYDNLPATSTPLSFPTGLWLDRDGGLWVADTGNQVIRRMDPATGVMKVVVGGGPVLDDAIPVPATSVRLERPSHIAGDTAGNIYFTDSRNNRVRRLTPDGLVTTVVGTGEAGFAGDGGPARLARLNRPTGLALDAAANLYIADDGNCRVRRIDTTGTIATIAGNGRCFHSGDGGPAVNAGLAGGGEGGLQMQGLAFDSRGNLYVVAGFAIRRIDRATGTITSAVNATNGCGPIKDGTPARDATPCPPHSTLFDPEDNLFFTYNDGVGKVNAATGLFNRVAGGSGAGLVRDSSGMLTYVHAGAQLLRVSASGGPFSPFTIIAGSFAPFDGPARLAILGQPSGMAVDAAGNVYIADTLQRRVKRFDPVTGLVTTVVGGGSTPLADGVAATAAELGDVRRVSVDSRGNVFFAPISWAVVWKVDARNGTISRVTGFPGQFQYSGDGGPATGATFLHISGIAVDEAGNIFISDAPGNRVRRVDAVTGIITTVAGNGTDGRSGDGGPATAAAVGSPRMLSLDRQGHLLIATFYGIRRVNLSTGVITSVLARSRESATLGPVPTGNITVDKDGNIFLIAGEGTPAGLSVKQIRASDSLLVAVAGSGIEGFFGDGGLATLARFASPSGIAADASGNIYVADLANSRVRKLSPTVVLPVMAVSPRTLSFTQFQGSSRLTAQLLNITTVNLLPFNWTLDISTSAGGNWLNASRTSGAAPSTVVLSADASRLSAGIYRGTVTVRASDASNSPQVVDVTLTVRGVAGPLLGISYEQVTFEAAQGGANPLAQALSISNIGTGTLSWAAVATTSSGGNWLRISPAQGTAPSTLTVSADISGLAPGIYQGLIVVRHPAAGETRSIPAVLVVTRAQPILQVSQTGFLFVGAEGSLVIGAQGFTVQNAGQGRLDWQIQVNLPEGGDWLRVSPLRGSSEAGQAAPQVALALDPSRLRAGVHIGLVTLTAPGALNSPQTAVVLVSMQPRGSPPVGNPNQVGLVFTAPAGATGALTQGITIASTGGQPLQFLAQAQTQAGGNWLSVSPEQGTILSSSEHAELQVEARPTGLNPGVYYGSITFGFGTGAIQEVTVGLVVASTTAGAPPSARHPITSRDSNAETSSACTPRRLVVVETKLVRNFSLQVGWPVALLAQVLDDCGSPVVSATVIAEFTGKEPTVVFQNLRNGLYSATWVPSTGGTVGVTIRALAAGLDDGVTQLAGTLGAGSALPLLFREGWVNAASFERFKPLAPGMIFSLFGNNLAEGRNLAGEVPLPRQLGNLKVTIGGIEAPLFYADGGQVNAQVPFELPVGRASLVVSARGSAGAPGQVTLAGAQPGIFTLSQSGTGQGVVLDAENRVADSSNPVRAGDVVVIYATGLGMTEPPVATGTAAPSAPLARVATPVTVTIARVAATVEFAGLAPGFVGLYQVNARVPEGVAAGPAVPLVLTQSGIASNTVTLAIR